VEIAVQLEIKVFSVIKNTDNNPSTIVLQPKKSQIHLSKIGLAHKEKTNVHFKKMF